MSNNERKPFIWRHIEGETETGLVAFATHPSGGEPNHSVLELE